MVFYDLTSTYFEGRGPAGLADFGYSRDGKRRNRQVQVCFCASAIVWSETPGWLDVLAA